MDDVGIDYRFVNIPRGDGGLVDSVDYVPREGLYRILRGVVTEEIEGIGIERVSLPRGLQGISLYPRLGCIPGLSVLPAIPPRKALTSSTLGSGGISM